MDYAMSVIIGRALPDVRDGLKPANRRVLFAMRQMGLASNRPYRKCAKIVGEVIGNYHPHGDAPAYDTLVRLAQDFNMRYPLVDGQGNFGSIDGDPPAAYRYTEARLQSLAEAMMADLDKDTVDFRPNFDETTEEPVVFPAPFPNLLVNGSTGIAVGMATSIPPHNMREVIDGVIARDRACGRRRATSGSARCCRPFPAPTFPSGGTIVGREGIYRAYKEGRGGVVVRGKATFEEHKKGDRVSIVVTEIPYQVNKATLIADIAELVRDKKHRRHLGPARRIRSRRHADRHRAQARRAARRRAEQPLQAHEAADELRHHAAGDRRPAGRACWACSRSSSTSSSSGARSCAGASSSSCARPKRARTSSKA